MSIRSMQLLPLLEDYECIGWRHKYTEDTSDFEYQLRLAIEKENPISAIEMFTIKEINDEPLPLFCVYLHGGDMVTCYEKIISTCECGAVLIDCIDCNGIVCSNGCDDKCKEEEE